MSWRSGRQEWNQPQAKWTRAQMMQSRIILRAVIAANHWENQHIRSDAKNGVLTLKGDVDTSAQRAGVERAAATVPGVQQVVNELEGKGKKEALTGFCDYF